MNKIKQESGIFIEYSRTKSQNIVATHPSPTLFFVTII